MPTGCGAAASYRFVRQLYPKLLFCLLIVSQSHPVVSTTPRIIGNHTTYSLSIQMSASFLGICSQLLSEAIQTLKFDSRW